MKKNLNIIQIKGFRGLLLAGFVICCLVAGFIAFPGWLGMQAWNYTSTYFSGMPAIGLIQGVLLWGIILTSYFVFRKEKVDEDGGLYLKAVTESDLKNADTNGDGKIDKAEWQSAGFLHYTLRL